MPWRTTKVHDSDRPWITKKLKLLIHKRQNAFTRFGKHSIIYKQLRNKVQSEIRLAKPHYYKHKVSDLEQANAKKWWKQIKILSDQTCHKEWYHQFLDSECPDIEALADKLNDFSVGLTDNFSPLPAPELNLQSVPAEFLVCENEVFTSLSALNISKATGPDQIPNRILKEFAQQLAPVVKDIFNRSVAEGYFPHLLKHSIINPIPKISPPQKIEKDPRPISLTSTLAKIMEGFIRVRLLNQVADNLDPRQYAREGQSTTDVLVYLLQAVHEATDSGNCGARILFTDFTKGFDLIDHNILVLELTNIGVHPVLINWIKSFLYNRRQAVRIGNSFSQWRSPNGGIPQGTKLGVILFNIMTNYLLKDWKLKIKFVDDTTPFEILPRNSMSLLNFPDNDTQYFSESHNMKLNPPKCKQMVINFMHNHNFSLNPIWLGNDVIETVRVYKLLGIILSHNLKWTDHVDYIYKKSSKRLYFIRLLKKSRVECNSIVKIYLVLIRPILEYAVQVWQDIPNFLETKLETIQKRALRIIFAHLTYEQALIEAGIETLAERRYALYLSYILKLKDQNHPLHFLLPRSISVNRPYNLRSATASSSILFRNKSFCKTQRSSNFITFKYL